MATRILHIMGGMHRGGVETCLMNFLRKIDRQRFQPEILVHVNYECDYDQELGQLGIPIVSCPFTHNPFIYAKNFLNILKRNGPYDIIHSHVHQFSGFIFWLSHLLGMKKLVAHSHSDTQSVDSEANGWRKFYLWWMTRWVKKYAPEGLACSEVAARALFGADWKKDPRWSIVYCGIDLTPFKKLSRDKKLREHYGIPADAKVIGHVGRFTPPKNHEFLLEIYQEVLRQQEEIYLLLIGDGPLFDEIKKKIDQLGLSQKIKLTGAVPNVPELLWNTIDIFVFPSIYEGLPLALLEAQAAGLQCIISEVITAEVVIIPDLIKRLPVSQPELWAANILESLKKVNNKISQEEALKLINNSSFNVETSVKLLENIYTIMITS